MTGAFWPCRWAFHQWKLQGYRLIASAIAAASVVLHPLALPEALDDLAPRRKVSAFPTRTALTDHSLSPQSYRMKHLREGFRSSLPRDPRN